MALTIEESILLSKYRAWDTPLTKHRYLSIRCYLLTGSTALTLAFYKQLFGVGIVQDFHIA